MHSPPSPIETQNSTLGPDTLSDQFEEDWVAGTNPREFAAIFDSKHDYAFENSLQLLEGILGSVIVRIGIVSGPYLVSRIENISDPSVPCNLPMADYPCGFAIKNKIPLHCPNLQNHKVLKKLPRVVECGAKYYANQFLTAQGGRIVGMICTYSREEKQLSKKKLQRFEQAANVISHLIQKILDRGELSDPKPEDDVDPHEMDFTSLFELSPVPTAVMSYPGFDYVAANAPMARNLDVFFDQSLEPGQQDHREWIPELRKQLEEYGTAHSFEVEIPNSTEGHRYFLLDARFLLTRTSRNILLTAREVTRERIREQQLKLILNVANSDECDSEESEIWFQRAAHAFAEITGAEVTVIVANCNQGKEIQSQAVLTGDTFAENFVTANPWFDLRSPYADSFFPLESQSLPADSPLRRDGINHLLAVPVTASSKESIGSVILGSSEKIELDPDTRISCHIFSTRIAARIARLHYDQSREAELARISMLQRVSQAVSSIADPDEALKVAAEEIAKVFDVSRCVIHRKDEQEDTFPVVAEYTRPPHKSMLGVRIPVAGNAHAEEVFASDKAVAISDVVNDSRFEGVQGFLANYEIRSMLAARTSFENVANGSIGLQHCGESTREWTEDEISLLGALVANIGVAIAQSSISKREKQQRLIIEKALKKANAASRAKSEFLARMSHELRTPLNSILGFSQLLGADKNLNSEQLDTLKIVNRSGNHLMTLINDVLEMSKIESGNQDIHLSVFSPRKLVEGLSELFIIRAESKGLVLKADLSSTLPAYIEGDENKLRQIITNLVGNAIKFTSRGEIRLTCSHEKESETASEASRLAFSIEDTGQGISEEELENLFTPFKQTKSGISSSEGTGLGLAISKSFVELLGGEFTVTSTPGVGSVFSFYVNCREASREEVDLKAISDPDESVPLAVDTTSFAPPKEDCEIHSTGRPTIIIADDQPENRLLVVKLLTSTGYRLVEAVDGQDAVDACRSYKPDMILMDVRMPGTDGLAATRTIRQLGKDELEKQPFIAALTGNAFEEDRRKAEQAGCDDFIAKPFRLEALLEMIKNGIQNTASCDCLPR
ncbi:MAG: ATP-binding protein [Verrucomicrobiales bacterium]|nr:ATP-binding protein [Verrucomicrobiales bacterium]